MSSTDLEQAVTGLEKLARTGQRPNLYVARHVLLALGSALRAGAREDCAALVERTRAAGLAAGKFWGEAVQDELTLACGEFAQCLDPRYLNLNNYDWEYTRSARARLEDRLRAATELGFRLAAKEAEVLALADQVLAASNPPPRDEGRVPQGPTSARENRPGPGDRPSHKHRPK